MSLRRQKVSLGFTQQMFDPGVHICQIFSDDDERQDALFSFVLSGLQAKERTSCFSEKTSEQSLNQYLEHNGVSYQEAREAGSLTHAGTRDIYFKDGRFDPERMLELLTRYHDDSLAQGYSGARVIGEMTPEVERLPGGSRLLEYESRISLLLREHPITAVCQYDARQFSGAFIMDILKVHPLMIIRNSVIHNPFFIPPEDYLAR